MRTIVLVLRLIALSEPTDQRQTSRIDWPDFFSRVTVTGVEYSDLLKSLEGKRVRLRGYSIPSPQVPEVCCFLETPLPPRTPKRRKSPSTSWE